MEISVKFKASERMLAYRWVVWRSNFLPNQLCVIQMWWLSVNRQPGMPNRQAACSCSYCRRTVRHRTKLVPVGSMHWRWRRQSMEQQVRRRLREQLERRNTAKQAGKRLHSRLVGLLGDRVWRRPVQTGRRKWSYVWEVIYIYRTINKSIYL